VIGGDDKKKQRGAAAPSQAGLYGGTLRPRPAKAKKKKKPKTINYGKCRGMLSVGFGKGRKTSASCRN
jgi:hypothetical protein